MKCKCQPEGKVCVKRIKKNDCPGIRINSGIMCLSSQANGFLIVRAERPDGNGNGKIQRGAQVKKSDNSLNEAKLRLVY